MISGEEFAAWVEFYTEHPFDDRHRFYRPAALIASRMAGGFESAMNLLEPPPADRVPDGMTSADAATMRAFGFKPGDLAKKG